MNRWLSYLHYSQLTAFLKSKEAIPVICNFDISEHAFALVDALIFWQMLSVHSVNLLRVFVAIL